MDVWSHPNNSQAQQHGSRWRASDVMVVLTAGDVRAACCACCVRSIRSKAGMINGLAR